MTEHAERHRKAAHELSRELANLRIRGDGTQNDEKAAEGAIAQALADAEAAGRLAGLDEVMKRIMGVMKNLQHNNDACIALSAVHEAIRALKEKRQ